MSTQLQRRRGTKAENDLFNGAEGEFTYDTDTKRVRTYDGSTVGGVPLPTYLDLQNNAFTAADAVGTDTITLDLEYAPTAYAEYQRFTFKPAANNTGAVTLNVNGLGAKNIKKDSGDGSLIDLDANDLKIGMPIDIVYDGTQFIAQLGGSSNSGYELLLEYDVSGDATLDFTSSVFNGNYSSYEIRITNLVPSTNGIGLYGRGSTDGGATFISTSSTYSEFGGSSLSFMNIAGDNVRNTGSGISGFVKFLNPDKVTGAIYAETYASYVNTSGAPRNEQKDYIFLNTFLTNNMDGFRIYASTGTLASGKITIYGVL